MNGDRCAAPVNMDSVLFICIFSSCLPPWVRERSVSQGEILPLCTVYQGDTPVKRLMVPQVPTGVKMNQAISALKRRLVSHVALASNRFPPVARERLRTRIRLS